MCPKASSCSTTPRRCSSTVTPPTKIEEPEVVEEELEEGELPEGEVAEGEEAPEGAAEESAEPEADAAGDEQNAEG